MEMSSYLHDVRVYDAKGMHVIGHLLSIDENKMVIASDLPMEPGHKLGVMLEDITEMEPGKKVKISGLCKHCDVDDVAVDLYQVELGMLDIPNKAKALVQALSDTESV